MRIWIIVGVSLLIGAVGGWAWTAAELGWHPGGDERIEWGSPASPLTPPAPASPGSAPKLVLEQDEFNFGSAEFGATGRHPFVIKNEGRGPLILTKGETSCVCTLAEIKNSEIPPGGSTTVEVIWHPKTHGPFRQSAQVLTNDPQRPRIELAIYGTVVSSYQLSPESIVFSNLAATRSATGQARVYSFATDKLAIVDPQWSDKSMAQFYELQTEPLTADQLKEEKGAKSGCLMKVTVKPGLPAGPFAERIRFHVNTADGPEFELGVEGNVTGPIEVWEPRIGTRPSERSCSAPCSFARRGEDGRCILTDPRRGTETSDLRLDKVTPSTLKVTVGKLEKLGPDVGRVPLTIEIPPGSRPEDHLGTQLGVVLARIVPRHRPAGTETDAAIGSLRGGGVNKPIWNARSLTRRFSMRHTTLAAGSLYLLDFNRGRDDGTIAGIRASSDNRPAAVRNSVVVVVCRPAAGERISRRRTPRPGMPPRPAITPACQIPTVPTGPFANPVDVLLSKWKSASESDRQEVEKDLAPRR